MSFFNISHSEDLHVFYNFYSSLKNNSNKILTKDKANKIMGNCFWESKEEISLDRKGTFKKGASVRIKLYNTKEKIWETVVTKKEVG